LGWSHRDRITYRADGTKKAPVAPGLFVAAVAFSGIAP